MSEDFSKKNIDITENKSEQIEPVAQDLVPAAEVGASETAEASESQEQMTEPHEDVEGLRSESVSQSVAEEPASAQADEANPAEYAIDPEAGSGAEGSVVRQRKRVARRHISKPNIIKALLAIGIILVLMGLSMTPVFVLKSIDIRGNHFVSDTEICRIANVSRGENMFSIQTDDIRHNLTKDIRIEQAVVKRAFPSRLEIQVAERVPVAVMQCDYGYLEIGHHGMILDAHRELRVMPVPVITGFSLPDLFVGDQVKDDTLNMVLQYLSQLDSSTLQKLSEINIGDPDNVIVYAGGSVQIRMGALTKLHDKLDVTESVVREMQQTRHPIEYVDARFENSYSVKLKEQ